MAIDAGDKAYRHGGTVDLESDGSGSAGDVVTFSGGQVTPTTSGSDDIVGVLTEDSPSAGEEVGVHVQGAVYVVADGAVSAGDLLQPSGTVNGAMSAAAANESLTKTVNEGNTDSYDVYSKYAFALDGAADGEIVPALLS